MKHGMLKQTYFSKKLGLGSSSTLINSSLVVLAKVDAFKLLPFNPF
jgi:hypothetical protein